MELSRHRLLEQLDDQRAEVLELGGDALELLVRRVVEAVDPLSERGVERPEAVVDMNRGRPNATLRDAAVTKVSMRAKRRWTTLVLTVNSTHTHTHC